MRGNSAAALMTPFYNPRICNSFRAVGLNQPPELPREIRDFNYFSQNPAQRRSHPLGHGTRRLLIDGRTFIRNVDRLSRYLQTNNGDARGRI